MTPDEVERLRALMAYEAARTAPPPAFPTLPDIPAARYTDPAFLRLEQQRLFGNSWLLAAHLDELPEPGSFLRWDQLDLPVVLVHAEDGEIHALVNRCRHRGAPVVTDHAGQARRLNCPYHGWSYALDGSLRAVREARDFGDLNLADRGLARLRCERYGQLVFVNLNPDAPSLRDWLGPVALEWQEFQLDRCRLSRRDVFELACNWKIAMEANMEVYHVPSVHPTTIAPVLDARRNVNTLYANGHGRMVAPIPAREGSPASWQSQRQEIATVGEIGRTCTQSYNLFPNLVVPLNQFVIPPIQFWPLGPDRCRVETWTMAPDWGDGDGPDMWTDHGGERPNRVLREDIEMSEAIQSNLAAGSDGGIPLSYQEARLYYWHQTADAVIGSSDIPEGLRVRPVIGSEWVYPNDPRLADS